MITPALMTVVFTVVFTRIVRIEIDDFPAFFISGYLLWQFFQNSCQGAIHSIVGNGDLVKKVYFPREVLPLALAQVDEPVTLETVTTILDAVGGLSSRRRP
jgi:ABC-type polysaccharide/polyol phosphate export permease